MNTLLVGYDLHKPGQDYPGLIDFLKSSGTYWHHLDSTWFVHTALTASAMRDKVRGYVDGNDEVLVLNVSGDAWASEGLTTQATDWLRKYV